MKSTVGPASFRMEEANAQPRSARRASVTTGARRTWPKWVSVIALGLTVAGCSPNRVVNGQIFVTTKGGTNVKMGAIGLHVVAPEQLALLTSKQLQEFLQFEQARKRLQKQVEVDQAALEKAIADLAGVVPAGLMVEEMQQLKQVANDRWIKIGEDARSAEEAFVRRNLRFADQVVASLPAAAAKTDADGRFALTAKPGDWLLARGERSIGEQTEKYLWAIRVPPTETTLNISNDDLLEEPDGVRDFLRKASGAPASPDVAISVTTSPETAAWITDSMTKFRQAVQEAVERTKAATIALNARTAEQAKALEERAAAETKRREEEAERAKVLAAAEARRAEAEAKALLATRLGWTGAAMRRTGYKEDVISRILTVGGTVTAWGSMKGLLPDGLSGIVAIAATDSHIAVLKIDGSVQMWAASAKYDAPAGLHGVVAIAAGASHSMALKRDGMVVAWGPNTTGACEVPPDLNGVVAIAAGTDYSVALKNDGTVAVWGKGNHEEDKVPAGLSDVVAISANRANVAALKRDGTVVVWGDKGLGQCNVPAGLKDVIAVSVGSLHVLALKADRTIAHWGTEPDENSAPPILRDVVATAAGTDFSAALKRDGTIVTWGANSGGARDVPKGLTGIVAMAATQHGMVVLRLE